MSTAPRSRLCWCEEGPLPTVGKRHAGSAGLFHWIELARRDVLAIVLSSTGCHHIVTVRRRRPMFPYKYSYSHSGPYGCMIKLRPARRTIAGADAGCRTDTDEHNANLIRITPVSYTRIAALLGAAAGRADDEPLVQPSAAERPRPLTSSSTAPPSFAQNTTGPRC